ncbi:hypothetical protein [Saccharopolyspora shandongensis]|uniref:hypothetical protein n=1 Tax=Saccharopolyspora shandongensis TaxID=418495 RepID=UPI0033CE5400
MATSQHGRFIGGARRPLPIGGASEAADQRVIASPMSAVPSTIGFQDESHAIEIESGFKRSGHG